MRFLYWLAPVVVGILQPVIWGMNLRVDKASGPIEAATVLHVVGVFAGLAWFAVGVRGAGFGQLASVPWWAWLGGVVGLSGMAATIKSMPVVGVSAATALIVAAQLGASIAFEHYGWLGLEVRPATWSKVAGALMLASGAWLVSR
jgi:transporter family-2 protein